MNLKYLFNSTIVPGLICNASAATIQISTVSTDTDIVNTGGMLVSSANFGEAAVTINGVFHGAGSTAGTNLTDNFAFEGDFRNGQTGLGGNLEILFSGIAGASGGAANVLSLSGLTIGQDYLFQTYWEGVVGQTLTITIEGDNTNGVADQPTGILISYAFTAIDDTLNISVDRDDASGGDPNNWLSGYSLQTVVPEPSSTALLGLGGLALILRRRR
jgi:hypothetical protein